MKIGLIIIGGIIVFYTLFQYLLLQKRIEVGLDMAKQTIAYTQAPPDAQQRILVIGDSTAVGVGADNPIRSVAGRLGADYPNAEIVNRGVSGLRIHGLREKLQSMQGEKFDLILINIGGNDIVNFTSRKSIEHDLPEVLDLANEMAPRVVVVTSGNVGTAPALPLGIRWVWGIRTRQVREIFLRFTKEKQVKYVDLYQSRKDDVFSTDPKKYYAIDSFHPSSEGYAVWYKNIGPTIHAVLDR